MAEEDKKVGQGQLLNEVAVTDPYDRLFAGGQKGFVKYNPDDLVQRKGLYIYDKMRRDDQIKAALSFKKNAALSTGWAIEVPEGKSKEWEVAKFVEETLNNIPGTIDRVLLEIMTSLDYGYSISEKIYEKDGQRVVLSNVKTRRPHGFEFEQDAYGNITALLQEQKPLPINKFIHHANLMEFQNWYGESDMRAAYRSYWVKDNSYKWMAMGMERLGIPPIFLLYDSDGSRDDTVSKMQTIISKMQAATTATIPRRDKDSLEIWSPSLSREMIAGFVDALSMLNQDIARGILMPGLLGATPDDNVGSNARSSVHFDVFMFVVERLRKELVEYVMCEQVIKQLVDLNYNTDVYPLFRLNPLVNEVKTEMFTIWAEMVSKNVVKQTPQDEEHIREVFEFPEREYSDNEDYTPAGSGNQSNGEDDGSSDGQPGKDVDGAKDNTEYAAKEYYQPHDHNVKLYREKNQYEKKINFAQIDAELAAAERITNDELKTELAEIRNKLTAKARKIYNSSTTNEAYSAVNELKMPSMAKVSSIVAKHLKASAQKGADDVMSSAKKDYAEAGVGMGTTEMAVYLATKAKNITGVLSERLQNAAKLIMIEGLRSGELFAETQSKLDDLFTPYIGDETVLKDDEVVSPHRLETIIRTNTTTAYNQGRLTQARRFAKMGFVHGVMYSAIMDSRTTDVCSTLDGKVFKPTDTSLDSLVPPNHFNCRSVLIEIYVDQQINEKDFITPSQKGKASDQAGKGFI